MTSCLGARKRWTARMVGVWLPDLVGDRRPQNLPGTWDEYPNWRLPVAGPDGQPLTLERIAASPRAHALLRTAAEGVGARTAPPGARAVSVFATFAPWTRRTPCAPAPSRPVRR